MSELFGKDMSQHVMKNNIMKDDFGWEIPYELVPIPSNGIIYHPDSSLYCLESVITCINKRRVSYNTSY